MADIQAAKLARQIARIEDPLERLTLGKLLTGRFHLMATSVVLNRAEIRELSVTPYEVVPAPGAGKALVPLFYMWTSILGATGYGNVVEEGSPFLSIGDTEVDSIPDDLTSVGTTLAEVDGILGHYPENEPLTLAVTPAEAGALTGGDAADAAMLWVIWAVKDFLAGTVLP